MIVHQPRKPPPAEILARRNMNLDQWLEQERNVRKAFYESVKAGSYDLEIDAPGINHQSFCDLPLLEGGQSEQTVQDRRRTMETVRTYVRAFFDRFVAQQPSPPFEEGAKTPTGVTLTVYRFVPR
jgi:hypothetical protein